MINWEGIKEDWESGGYTLKEISEIHSVSLGTIKSRKSREKWGQEPVEKKVEKAGMQPKKKDATATRKDATEILYESFSDEDLENSGLNEKQQLFVLYYLKSLNAKMAAIKAGYSPDTAHVQGSRLLNHAKVSGEIRRLKATMHSELFIDAMDVIRKYIDIAFSDITDFAWFGKREVPVMNMFGPINGEDGKPLMKEVNFVDFKDSEHVDGTLITEVRQGKEGIVVKMADKMEAMRFLTKHFDIVPDHFKRQLEEEKLKIAHARAYGTEGQEHYEDDGFHEALNAKVPEVWTDAVYRTSERSEEADRTKDNQSKN